MSSFNYNIFILCTRVCYQTYVLILGARKNIQMYNTGVSTEKNLAIHIYPSVLDSVEVQFPFPFLPDAHVF